MIRGYICSSALYDVDGILIELPGGSGPCPLRKDGDPKMRLSKKDKAALDKFYEMSQEEKQACRVGGGCISF